MGIDIRDGSQLECIQCALCIDACNDIMSRIGRPRNLIAYDTIARQDAAAKGGKAPITLIRARTVLSAALICLVGSIMLVTLMNRTLLDVSALPDRNPLYVRLANGDIRNGYTLKILNKLHEPRTYSVTLSDPPGAGLTIAGTNGAGQPLVTIPTDSIGIVRAFVTVPATSAEGQASHVESVTFMVRDVASGLMATRRAHFEFPNQSR
jgi:polyferredoxin